MMKKKLIEVALPLETINKESAREKSIRHGHPSTLHLWWARRPLAACRAVLFASLVDDPSSHPDLFPTEEMQRRERERLFDIIERLVKWENSKNEQVLHEVREEILKHTNGNPPPVYDPFAGGGSIPLEAQRLGLEARASDLNPVAVLINKALIEIPPKFANKPPVNTEGRNRIDAEWKGAAGLAADVRYYGKWMRDEAEKRIGHLYPKVKLPKEYGGGEATVIAWLWARTVKCPNPACGAQMPLVRSFALSTKKGKETWAEPIVDRATKIMQFEIQRGAGKPSEGTVSRRGARCIVCDEVAPLDHVRTEGRAGRMNAQMMVIAAEGKGGRIYLAPTEEHERIAASAQPAWKPNELVTTPSHDVDRLPMYGMFTWGDAFTPRQLVSLTTFSDLVAEARALVRHDTQRVGDRDATAYADAVTTYLAFAVDRNADRGSTICSWDSSPKMEALRNTFARQAIPMTWDFAEGNTFSDSSGNWTSNVDWIVKVIEALTPASRGEAKQHDATSDIGDDRLALIVSTDPPYYDNISYADLSDFFYVWLKNMLDTSYPELFKTLLTPKGQELVASPYRFGGDKKKAKAFFENGLGRSFANARKAHHPDYPFAVFYAFKQSESGHDDDALSSSPTRSSGVKSNGVFASTGWETMLDSLIESGFAINGTWPMRTEMANRSIASGTNALASSIILVCRPRREDAKAATRREFLNALKAELPSALRKLQQGNIAPVDLAQAAIGPGMAVFSRYSKVIEADGTPMRVRTALQLINQELDVVLAEQEGEFDADTRWAIAWFDQHGTNEGPYGTAETLSKAKNTSVGGMVEAGIAVARGGKVRLLKRDELPEDWNPASDRRRTVWEIAQHLVHGLDKRGEGGAAELLAKVGGEAEIARDLAYRLYTTCERKGWAQEALAYNALVVAWPEITRQAAERRRSTPVQGRMEI